MRTPKKCKRILAEWIIAAGLLTNTGCLCFHETQCCTGELAHPCHELPRACRCHVYVFLVNGLDPCEACTVRTYADWLHSLGFCQTYSGQCYHAATFENEICKIHKEDPDARFVLMGFSLGAKTIDQMARSVKDGGVHIDLMVYVDGKLFDCGSNRPENVGKVVSVHGRSCSCDGAPVEAIQALDQIETSAADMLTKQVLVREMAAIAVQVPYTEKATAVDSVREEDAPPKPRQVVEESTTNRDEWDFLKPVSQLSRKEALGEKDEKPTEQKLGSD